MQQAQKDHLQNGIYAAALTPMHSDLSCNHQKLTAHCCELLKQGCTGVTLFGTTGEGPSFSLSERLAALQYLVSKEIDPKKIILANGSSGILDSVELASHALKLKCAAVLIAPPSFYKNISDAGVLAYYREIIQKVGDPNLRILLYHIPQMSGVPISLNVIAKLREEFPQIVIGIKESEGNLSLTKAILEAFPHFKVFVGNEKQIIESVQLGGAGSICGIANLYPKLICSLYQQGQKASDLNLTSLESIFSALHEIPFIAAAKRVMERRAGEGWYCMRPPLLPLQENQGKFLISALQQAGLEQ